MAFLVEPPIDEPRIGIIFLWRDAEIRVMVGDELTELPLPVGSISENGRSFEVDLADQFLSNGTLRRLTTTRATSSPETTGIL